MERDFNIIAQTISAAGYTINVRREWIPVTEGVDPYWVGVDAAGHTHAAKNLRDTLVEITEPCHCDLVDEPHDRFVRWECRECGETVHPERLNRCSPPRSIPGPLWAEVEGPIGCWRTDNVEGLLDVAQANLLDDDWLDFNGKRTEWRWEE